MKIKIGDYKISVFEPAIFMGERSLLNKIVPSAVQFMDEYVNIVVEVNGIYFKGKSTTLDLNNAKTGGKIDCGFVEFEGNPFFPEIESPPPTPFKKPSSVLR